MVLAVLFALMLTACNQGSSGNSSAGAATTPSSSTASTASDGASTELPGGYRSRIPMVEFSSSQYSVGQAAGSVSLTVLRNGPATAAASVVYGTTAGSGTAVTGTDYVFTKGTLSWAENDSTPRTISIPISNATPFSGTKTFNVQLWAPSPGLMITEPANAAVQISGDASTAAGTLQLTQGSYSVSQGAGALTVGVTRTGGSSGEVEISYSTEASGTATAGTDFTATTGALQWADGDSSTKMISIPISNATPFSGSRTFSIVLSEATGGAALGTPDSATVSISGDYSAPAGSLELSSQSYTVDQAAGTVQVTVNRINGSEGAVAVSYATADGTASAPGDYAQASGTLQWADGDSTAKSFSVSISNTTPFSGTRAFDVVLSAPTGAVIGSPGTATVSINGDAPAGTIALAASSASVAQSAGSVTISVNRTSGSNGAVTVSYATSDGTAVAGSDYTAASGTLSWASGDATAKSFTVPISQATAFSGNKSFNVSLSNVTGGASLGTPSSLIVTITGSASAASGSPQLSQSSYSVLQSAGSLSVTVNRTGGSSGAFSVNYATSDGTATAGFDYTATSGTLQWQSGDATSKSFQIPVSNATPFSGTKAFTVILSAPTGGVTLGAPSSASVAIQGSASASTTGAPTNLQVILQGQSGPMTAAFYNSRWGGPPSTVTNQSPNLQEIGWDSVVGATQYNIYDNGTEIASVSDASASSAYSSYVSNQGAYPVAPGINRAYLDTNATNVISGTMGNVLNATGSIDYSSSPHTLSISSIATNTIVVGQQVNANAGLPNNDTIASFGSGTGGTGTYYLSSPATSSESNQQIFIGGNGSFTATATWTAGSNQIDITAISPQAVAAGQGIGGPGIPVGTTIAAFGSTCDGMPSTGTGGTGTYCLSNAATTNETNQTYGTVYLPNQPHLMQVTAVVNGVESAKSSYAIIPFIVNGELICSAGVFTTGSLITGQVAPATTPLGYGNAAEWVSNSSYNLINTYSGNSCASYDLGMAGYGYINFAIYTPASGLQLQYEPEIAGDGELEGTTTFASQGYTPQPVTAGQWVTYKMPLAGPNGIYLDSTTGLLGKTNVPQTAFYKITWQWANDPTVNSYVEIWFSVN